MTQAIDVMEFRKALGAFVTGVTVVSTRQSDGTPRGFTANSFTSVSLDPALLLICIGKTAASYPVFSDTQQFSISILAEDQKQVSSIFASKAADKFEQVAWHQGVTGSPIIDGAAAWFDCVTHQLVDAGDHIILIGRVVDFSNTAASPLGYGRGAYLTFSLSQDALAATGQRAKVGAILESNGGVLLLETDKGYQLPTGTRLEPASDSKSLRGVLEQLGVDAQLDFLFAVFDEPAAEGGAVNIYYRGRVQGDLPADSKLRVVAMDEIPWDQLTDEAVRSMLQRFVRERTEDAFGIYIGDSHAGSVQPLAKS
ncbi:flavin reductase [Vogesella sp. LYT5W]|uniref:Flavin reductase n=1 Tax=Vogesella margarita TaxID=2984199 RepID=A0ABT5IMB5_9NEIS|nr:flavin reductase [Vogesella margarita]MDC7713667.1 flavin reductase [Vogesella margarita]